MIRDKVNVILDSLPKEELEKVYWSIKYIQEDYMFKKNILDKGVILEELFDEEEIRELWDNTFANNINKETRDSIHYNQFKWHIFSYEKQDCLNAEEARIAFDTESKDELYMMYQNSPRTIHCSQAKEIVATDFDNQQDIYIFNKDLNWTYVHTHESTCGPYFYKVK